MDQTGTRTVIVGVDGTERSADALALAAALAPRLDAVPLAAPARALQQAALDRDAALIVLGASRRSGIGRVFPGSSAARLLAGSPCPVAIAPRGYADRFRAVRTIAVAFDGSQESRAALAWSKELARATHGRVLVVSVHQPIVAPASAFQTVPMVAEEDVVRQYVSRRAKEAAREIELDDVEADALVLTGDPADLLVEQTERVDLMVAGSRGYGPARSVLVGSVSGALAHRAACPVVVLPRGADVEPTSQEGLVAARDGIGHA
jgi:nucleotide-binding universal stress UspA family protein